MGQDNSIKKTSKSHLESQLYKGEDSGQFYPFAFSFQQGLSLPQRGLPFQRAAGEKHVVHTGAL